jgi:hypothetical protein
MTLGMQQHEPQRDTQWSFSHTHLLLASDFENDQTTVRYQIVSTGIVFIALGLAALLLPIHSGSWDSRLIAGLMGVIGGLGYTGFILWEMRK